MKNAIVTQKKIVTVYKKPKKMVTVTKKKKSQPIRKRSRKRYG